MIRLQVIPLYLRCFKYINNDKCVTVGMWYLFRENILYCKQCGCNKCHDQPHQIERQFSEGGNQHSSYDWKQ